VVVVLALGTLVVMVVGEKINAKLPWALAGRLGRDDSQRRRLARESRCATAGHRERRTADLAPALVERVRVGTVCTTRSPW